MAVLILPAGAAPDPADAVRFQTVIDDPLTVVMIVRGDDHDAERALEKALGRASAKPLLRRVIWLKDDACLDDGQRKKYLRQNKVITSVGLDDRVADSLTKTKARIAIYVERAFLAAESQVAPA